MLFLITETSIIILFNTIIAPFKSLNKFFNITKEYKTKFIKSFNKSKEYLNTNGDSKDGLMVQWNCLKRRVNIKIHKLTR